MPAKIATGIGQRPFDAAFREQRDTIAATHTDRMKSGSDALRARQHFVRRDRDPTAVAFVIQCVRTFVIARDSVEDVDERSWFVRSEDERCRARSARVTSMYSTARFTRRLLR